jgi:hypothetical protein
MLSGRDLECLNALNTSLNTAVGRHADAGRGGAAKEGAEPNDVTQKSGGP